jgi:hypothetical protein
MRPLVKAPAKRLPPFPFVLDLLASLGPVVRPMFGCFALYDAGKILLVLRKRKEHPSMNGVWVATSKEHHESLRKIVPCLRSIPLLGKGVTQWQMIAEEEEEFEPSVMTIARLVLGRDPRIGTLPKARAKRPKRSSAPR